MKNIENAVRSLLEFSAWMPRWQIPALLGLDATQPKEQLKSGKTLFLITILSIVIFLTKTKRDQNQIVENVGQV